MIGLKHKNSKTEIEDFLNKQPVFDFLILTESIHLNLPNYKFQYSTEKLPENVLYEELNYTEYLKVNQAFRVIIYSQFPILKQYIPTDEKTSLALEFQTEFGNILIYATIIGTWFKRKPYAKKELENCLIDCRKIYEENPNLFIIGDLTTSFQPSEKELTINSETTNSLENLFSELNLYNSTREIPKNIDHIIIPKSFQNKLNESQIFIEKNKLSDHQGVYISII